MRAILLPRLRRSLMILVCFFSLLTNINATLNFFINNELTNSEIICDYFNEKCFVRSSLSNECLSVSMYVHYLNFTQANNFK